VHHEELASHPNVAEALFKACGIIVSMSGDVTVLVSLKFSTDIGFFAPTLTFAKWWPGEAHVYFFNEPNPWEGRFKGNSSHIIGVAFLFQNYNKFLNPAQAQSARLYAVDVIRFANGKAPWRAFDVEKTKCCVYGPSEEDDNKTAVLEVSGNDLATKRRHDIFQFADDPGLDVISSAFGMFFAGQ
jgi:hypothetical protein